MTDQKERSVTPNDLDRLRDLTEKLAHVVEWLQPVILGRSFDADPYACAACGRDLADHYATLCTGKLPPELEGQVEFTKPDLPDIRDGHVLCGECGHPERWHDTDDLDHPTECTDGRHREGGEWEPCGCKGFRLRVEDMSAPTPTPCEAHGRHGCLYASRLVAAFADLQA